MMERISAAEYRARHKAKRKAHKYGALPAWRCEACGAGATAYGACPTCGEAMVRFDSRAEAKRFDLLHSMERTRMISDLRRQVPFELHAPGGALIGRYVADFVYRSHDGRQVIEDVKGVDTPVSRWKRRHVEAEHGVTINIIT
jgi:hypothetical protein